MSTTAGAKQIIAVIDIGASAVRMVIAEVGSKGEISTLENLQKPIKFGKDVFTTGILSMSTMREGLSILKNFKSVLDTYGVKKIHAIATSAVREAANRENFLDQVYVRTGIEIEVIEGPEQNRLELIAVESALQGKVELDKKNCLILEVGSGSTEMILLNQGQVEITRTLSLGSIRLPERAIAGKTDAASMQRILKRNIHEITAFVAHEYSMENLDTFIALGADLRFVCQQLTEMKDETYVILEKKSFSAFVTKISKMTPEEIVAQHNLPYAQAECLVPSLLVYLNFLNETKAENLIVPMTSIRDGLLIEMAQMLSGYKRTDVSRQVLNSCRHLGEKFRYDKAHAQHVASLSVKLYDLLKQDHGLGSRERLLLEVSGMLHDIGTYISPSSHHKHSSYLVDASEIFGLRKSDKNIVSNVVRYHRGAPPKSTHINYMSLPKDERSVVTKLAAILRVADSLDHGHQQRISNFILERQEEAYQLWIPEETGDVTLERDSIQEKGNLFVDVFGAPIHLKQGTPPVKKESV